VDTVTIFKALADDTRLKIVRFLLKKSNNVTDIVSYIKKSQPNVSLALKQLNFAGIILQEKKGREIFYSIKNTTKIKKLIELVENEK
jgi:DNA-binding transcriptional ArsR family regulator